jgi:hypothetical protein
VKKALVSLLLLLCLLPLNTRADEKEIPSFGLLLNSGGCYSSGFISSYQTGLSLGLGLSFGFDDRWDGLWSIDHYDMPNMPLTLSFPTPSDPVSQIIVQPTDDVAIAVNTRWYWWNKFDYIHQRFNTVPYLTGGLGLDLMVDEFSPPQGADFWSNSFDILLGLNLGAGMDVSLGDSWILYGEGLDHLVFWQGLSQVFIGRVGIKVMLDSAHVDPFRGLF